MQNRKIVITFAVIVISLLFLAGCKNFITPELGVIANEKSRIPLESGKNVYEGKDLKFTYELEAGDDIVRIKGQLSFDRGLTDSFPIVKNIFFKMSFLDGDGRVLETVDITPMFRYKSQALEPLSLKQKEFSRPPGASHFVFNYYGTFHGDTNDVTEDWDVFSFPFQ
jgi:hypothetical protein